MTSTDTYQLKWHSHSSHLNGSVASLLRSERFTDVVLCTMDGSQIPAHKFILSSCSVYLSSLFEGQRSVTRMGGMLYVVLPSEISTKALKILVEYMYKGETTVSNEVLDTVLKAGEVLKVRGLWRQTDEAGGDSTPAEKTTTQVANINKQVVKKPEEPKLTVKKDDKLLKTFSPVQQQGVTRPMFIGPPKLVFIKTSEGGTQAALRPGASKGQTILVAPAPTTDSNSVSATSNVSEDSLDEAPPPRILRRHAAERKYGKKQKTDHVEPEEKEHEEPDNASVSSIFDLPSKNAVNCKNYRNRKKAASLKIKKTSLTTAERSRMYRLRKKQLTQEIIPSVNEVLYTPSTSNLLMTFEPSPHPIITKKSSQSIQDTSTEIQIKDEPEWDASSIEEEERSIAEMFQAEMSVKSEPLDEMDIEEESLLYSPLACELCAEVFTVPAAWVRHVQRHAHSDHHHARKRKRSESDDTEETMALLRCDLCQKHFPNPAEWVRHVQSTHTESDGEQNKICSQCKKTFPSHASMLIHMRTHTGERPFVCGLCNKGFNVKSNLLRHLRTLHDQDISPAGPDHQDAPGGSFASLDVKRET